MIDQSPAFPDSTFRLLLTNKDYATAYRIADAINERFPNHARARDSGSVDVMFPYQYQRRKMDFVVGIQDLRIIPDVPARVVVNQNTGTIVVGHNVKLTHVAFANENLVVTTAESPIASQPAPLSNGQTAILDRTQVTATQTGGTYNVLNEQPTVADLATMLNQMGIPPRDFINILRQIEAAGHLQAELIVR